MPLSQLGIVEKTDAEVKILKGLGRHPGALRHGRMGPAENTPAGFVDPLVEHRAHLRGDQLHVFCGHVGKLIYIVAAANRDVTVHRLHLLHRGFGDYLILLCGGTPS